MRLQSPTSDIPIMTEPHLTRDEIREIVHEAISEAGVMTKPNVREVVREAVEQTLLTLGVDAKNPLTVQQDMHFVRELRSASESVRSKGLLVVVGILITAALGALWVGIKGSMLP